MATAVLTSTASCSSPFHYASCSYGAHNHTLPPPPFTKIPAKLHLLCSARRRNRLGLAIRSQAAVSPAQGQGAYDPELRSVLELATHSELCELDDILFGPSYFSPLLKSVAKRAEVDYVMIEQDLEGREDFIAALESRFLFLAADARSTLRGWRPSYRDVLLTVRKKWAAVNSPLYSSSSSQQYPHSKLHSPTTTMTTPLTSLPNATSYLTTYRRRTPPPHSPPSSPPTESKTSASYSEPTTSLSRHHQTKPSRQNRGSRSPSPAPAAAATGFQTGFRFTPSRRATCWMTWRERVRRSADRRRHCVC